MKRVALAEDVFVDRGVRRRDGLPEVVHERLDLSGFICGFRQKILKRHGRTLHAVARQLDLLRDHRLLLRVGDRLKHLLLERNPEVGLPLLTLGQRFGLGDQHRGVIGVEGSRLLKQRTLFCKQGAQQLVWLSLAVLLQHLRDMSVLARLGQRRDRARQIAVTALVRGVSRNAR